MTVGRCGADRSDRGGVGAKTPERVNFIINLNFYQVVGDMDPSDLRHDLGRYQQVTSVFNMICKVTSVELESSQSPTNIITTFATFFALG